MPAVAIEVTDAMRATIMADIPLPDVPEGGRIIAFSPTEERCSGAGRGAASAMHGIISQPSIQAPLLRQVSLNLTEDKYRS
jgi:hypothetical protein